MAKSPLSSKPDYEKLLDKEMWAYIRETYARYPECSGGYTIAQRREIYEICCRAHSPCRPSGITVEKSAVRLPDREIPVRVYTATGRRPQAEVLFFHGGGFVVGSLDSHDDVCAEICERTCYRVTSVGYRKAPENPYPACFNDGMAAYGDLISASKLPVVLCGDSAGGNLCAAIAQAARGPGRQAAGLVLIYPGLTGHHSGGTYVTHAKAPLLGTSDLRFFRDARSPDRNIDDDPHAAPLSDADFSGLPPVAIFTAECDPLSGDGRAYRDAIVAAGGRAAWFNEKGLIHGYLSARHTVGRARESFSRIIAAILALGRGEWPYEETGD